MQELTLNDLRHLIIGKYHDSIVEDTNKIDLEVGKKARLFATELIDFMKEHDFINKEKL